LPTNTTVFLRGLCRPQQLGYQNQKRKLGVTTQFSEISELKFGKKMPDIICILKLFLELWMLISENAWLPTFFFLDFSNTC